jgi:hypothetical protein
MCVLNIPMNKEHISLSSIPTFSSRVILVIAGCELNQYGKYRSYILFELLTKLVFFFFMRWKIKTNNTGTQR